MTNEKIALLNSEYSSSYEEELDAIRLAIYKKTKDMNSKEYTNYVKKSVAPILKQYGLKTVKN
jgi:hypothetical protein